MPPRPGVRTRSSLRRRDVDDVDGDDASASKPNLLPADAWIAELDLAGFKEDVAELGKELRAAQGPEDVAHLKKILLWANVCTLIGMCTMALPPMYVFPAIALSLGSFARWTMVAHHTCHGGYDKVDPTKKHNRWTYAVGSLWRRANDWFDWMLPEAWNVEHNNSHHYHLGENADPDLVENNLVSMRESSAPMIVKYAKVAAVVSTWKWLYYAPNTWKELQINRMRKSGVKFDERAATTPFMLTGMFSPEFDGGWVNITGLFSEVLLPYFLYRFVLSPLPLLFLFGKGAFANAILNLCLAELFTNLHSFVVIASNHAGHDLYRFATHCKPKSGTFYLRQVISSVDFWCGGDVNDFLHGFLNYQIEHHCWPDLSMRSYQKGHPLLKEICKRHGVPWVQEDCFTRTKKTLDIMVGKSSMRQYPIEWERPL